MVAAKKKGWDVPELIVAVSVGAAKEPEIVSARVPVNVFVIVPLPETTAAFSTTVIVSS